MKEEKFMDTVKALFLNQARMPLADCYRIAKKRYQTHGGTVVPSLATVRSAIRKMPANIICNARA